MVDVIRRLDGFSKDCECKQKRPLNPLSGEDPWMVTIISTCCSIVIKMTLDNYFLVDGYITLLTIS